MTNLRDDKILPIVLIVVLLSLLLEPIEVAFNTAVIVGVILFPRWRFPLLMAAAFFYWYGVDRTEAVYVELQVLRHGWEYRAAALIGSIAIVAFFVRFRSRLKYPVLTSYVLLISVFLLAAAPYRNPDVVILFQTLTIYFKFFFWYLVFLMIETESSFQSHALFTLPFWSHPASYLPSSTGPAALMSYQAQNEQELHECRWAAVKILFTAVVIQYAAVLLNGVVFEDKLDWIPSLEIPRMRDDFGNIMEDQAFLPLWQKWLALISHVLLRYMDFAGNFAVVIGQARAVGFRLPPMTNAPWQATSFGDLFSRLMYHYNRMLMKVFYPRIKESLKFLPRGRAHVLISLFLSISFGGILFHFPRDSRSNYFNFGFYQSLTEYLNAFPYFIVLAAFVCVTVHFRDKRKQATLAWRIIRPGVYFTLFSLIYSLYMAGVHNRSDWSDYYNYLLNLLNLA